MAMIELDLRPDGRKLRQFGWAACVVFGAVGALIALRGRALGIHFGDAAVPAGVAIAAVGLLSAVFALAAPAANRPLYVALIVVTYPIGFVVSLTIVALIFFGMLTPLGLFFRLIGRDPLQTRFDKAAPTYWVERERGGPAVGRYFKQF